MFGHGVSDFYNIHDAVPDKDGFIHSILVPVRDTVIFPRMVSPVSVDREKSMGAIASAQIEATTVIVALQKQSSIFDPRPDDLYPVGVEMALGRLMHMPDGTSSILAQGRRRVEIIEIEQSHPFFVVKARPIETPYKPSRHAEALMRAVLTLFERCVKLNRSISQEAYIYAINIDDPGWLADLIASTLPLKHHEKQEILEKFDPVERLHRISVLLGRELDVLELEEQIQTRVKKEVQRGQREMYLREQMRVIQNELGEVDIFQQEFNELQDRINAANLPEEVYEKAIKDFNRLQMLPPIAPEVGILRTYLETLLDLPWVNETIDNLDIQHAKDILEEHHYGMEKVKERILEHLAVRKLAPHDMRTPILCFIGPPGTGKTSVGKSIAIALEREFVRISLGGVHDEAEIRGHRRTYIGALPGRIVNGMRRAGTVNPVFVLDEIDKLGRDVRGDPAAALLEVLDPEQNFAFSDHYLEVPYDLSKVLFIGTANTLDTIPPALLDRMEIIEFPGYVDDEKLEIARQFLVARQMREHGIDDQNIRFEDTALVKIMRSYTREAGVRNFEREIANVCRKLARRVAEDKRIAKKITPELVEEFLGPVQYLETEREREDLIGIATSMAWSAFGGDLLSIEVSIVPGTGKLQLTGKLGDVMQESARAALSYLRSRAESFSIDAAKFEHTDIHIHVPSGAVPKDGPSAGMTIAVALVSAFTGQKVRHEIAMTGEITLRGRILPIGGVREKILAAHRTGVRKVILPRQNQKDLVEINRKTLREMDVILVEHLDEVLPHVLVSKARAPMIQSASSSSASVMGADFR
ncbi:MAG: endopeptidase La [Anaerolineae bacterium]|nr:MAG: endopeptidase La [Anaerolineae bacterium]